MSFFSQDRTAPAHESFHPLPLSILPDQHHDKDLRFPRRIGGRGNRQPVGWAGVEERGFRGRSCWAIVSLGLGNAVGQQHADLDHGTSGCRVAIRRRTPRCSRHEAGRGREGVDMVAACVVCCWYVREARLMCHVA